MMRRISVAAAVGATVLGLCVIPAQADIARNYRVVELPTLGGAYGRAVGINNRGLVHGWADLPGDSVRHAVVWTGRRPIDLGTLGGTNSAIVWPNKNTTGLIVGISETATPDPLHEDWSCAAFIPADGHTCRGFVWDGHRMRELPTLGGNNGFASGVNDHGDIVGWAETAKKDPTCTGNQQLQFRPVIYGPRPDQARALPLPSNDTSGAATAINDRGQVVGISGLCDQAVGRLTARHAVLWSHGRVRDLGNLGAAWWNTPMAINEHGTIVGFAGDPADIDGTVTHAFVWTRKDGMRPLLPPGTNSIAYGVNDRNQIVGAECDVTGTDCHGFLWQDGKTTLLDDVAAGYSGTLTVGADINDRGVIAGRATTASGRPPIVLVPDRRP